jgi:hypothetical protein
VASEALNAKEKVDPECMSCHGTGAEQGNIGRKWEKVQCEACHGPGKLYIKLKPEWKKDREETLKLAMDVGFVLRDEKVCLRCHGQDRPAGHPPAEAFNYKEAHEKVAHKSKRPRIEYSVTRKLYYATVKDKKGNETYVIDIRAQVFGGHGWLRAQPNLLGKQGQSNVKFPFRSISSISFVKDPTCAGDVKSAAVIKMKDGGKAKICPLNPEQEWFVGKGEFRIEWAHVREVIFH